MLVSITLIIVMLYGNVIKIPSQLKDKPKLKSDIIKDINIPIPSYSDSLLEASMVSTIAINLEGIISAVNQAFELLIGINEEGLIGTNITHYFSDVEGAQKMLLDDDRNIQLKNHPMLIQKFDKSLAEVSYSSTLYKMENEPTLGMLITMREIQTNKTPENYTRSLIEASQDPLMVIDTLGTLIDANKATMKVTEKTLIQLVGSKFSDHFIEKENANLAFRLIFENGFIEQYPLTMIDSRLISVLLDGSVYRDIQENVLGAVIVVSIISDNEKIQAELIEAKVNAEHAAVISEEAKNKAQDVSKNAIDAVKSKQQFLSNMSHEIRTPMNAIIGFAKVLLKTELNAKQREYLTAIKISGDSLIILINDILDLAKVDSGKMTFESTPFKLKNSINAMIHLFEAKIQEKNLVLTTEYDEKIPQVILGDSLRLHQIILNLVGNAVKFTSFGSIHISVNMVNESDKAVQIEFNVTDTGIGIVESKLDSIFESFHQASSDTSRLFGGTGLGLAIVKKLVESQGGTISVVSKLNIGTTFSFTLDFIKTLETNIIDDSTHEIDKQHSDIKVLVVEDIALNQLLMKTLLDDFGFERDIASNGRIAIERLELKSYDIILMDLQMPEMNGFETTEYIRNVLHSNIPIIALTADVTTVDLAKCKAIGMNDYIPKPVDDKILYSKIVGLVKKSKHSSPLMDKNQEKIANKLSSERLTDLNYLTTITKSNRELMLEMITAYLDQTPALIATMNHSLQMQNWESLHAAVHKMIPSFTIVGMSKKFEDIAIKITKYASILEHKNGIDEMVSQLEKACTKACNELQEEYNKIKNSNA